MNKTTITAKFPHLLAPERKRGSVYTTYHILKITQDLKLAIVLQRIVDQCFGFMPEEHDCEMVTRDGRVWWAKSNNSWYNELKLTDHQVRRMLKQLKDIGIIDVCVGAPYGVPVTHIAVNLEVYSVAMAMVGEVVSSEVYTLRHTLEEIKKSTGGWINE